MLAAALELDQAESFTLKAFPPGPNGIPLSLMNTVGWVVNANADEATQRVAGEYIFSWEKWLRTKDGGGTMRRLGVAPGLISLFKDSKRDQFYSDKLPTDWSRTIASLKECGRSEASNSALVSAALTPVLLAEFQRGLPVNTRMLLKHLMLAQYDAGIRD